MRRAISCLAVLAMALSFFPYTAPVTLLMREGAAPIPAWQLALALGILIATALGMVWVAGRMLRYGMLRYGAAQTAANELPAVDFVQADRLRRKVALEMARIFNEVDVMLVPSLRDEQLTITNFTGHPSLTLRAGFVNVSEARSDWAPDPANPPPRFSPPRRVPHGITILGRLFDDGLIGRVGVALERAFNVAAERPAGF